VVQQDVPVVHEVALVHALGSGCQRVGELDSLQTKMTEGGRQRGSVAESQRQGQRLRLFSPERPGVHRR